MTRSSESRYGSNYGKSVGPMGPVVNLHKASLYVAQRMPFNSTHCYGRWQAQQRLLSEVHDTATYEAVLTKRNYVVYSGSTDYALALFVYDEFATAWFENTDGIYGAITTKQRKRLRPEGDVHKFEGEVVQAIARFGYAHVAKLRLERKTKRDWRDELRAFVSQQGTVTGRWSGKPSMQELAKVWRTKHVINELIQTRMLSPSAQELYNELVDIAVTNQIGGKKP